MFRLTFKNLRAKATRFVRTTFTDRIGSIPDGRIIVELCAPTVDSVRDHSRRLTL